MTSANPYELVVTPPAARAIQTGLTEAVAAAVIEFLTGALISDPRRVGKPLRGDLAGPDGMLDGPDASGMLAAPGGRIAGGTSEVQRNIIGERLLGLPREPKPESSRP